MKGKGKGISGSALPYKRRSPKWITMSPTGIVELSTKLAKKGLLKKYNLIIKNQGLTPS